MDQKDALVGKDFSGFTTQIRFLPVVTPDVLRQRGRLVEFLVTKLTGIRTFTGVKTQMCFQHFGTWKPFAAGGTNIQLHFGVSWKDDALSGKSSHICHSDAAAQVSGVQLSDDTLTLLVT